MYRYKGENSAFVKRLKLLMDENNTSIEELSVITGMSILECDKMLRGKDVTFDVLINLVLHYNVACDFILGLSDDRERKRYR